MASTKIRGITIELNADTAGIADGLKKVNTSLGQTERYLKDVDKLLKFDDSNTTLLAQKQEYLNSAIEDTEKKLKLLNDQLAEMKNAGDSDQTREQQQALAREIEATSQKLSHYKSQLNQTDDALDKVGNETEEAKEKTLTFGDVLKANIAGEVILSSIRKLADGIKEIAVNAMETGMSFESSMSQVAATMGITVSEIEQGSQAYDMLSEAARKCGATTMFTASQAADALNYLALAGYDAQKAAETLPKVLTLAAAGGMDLAYASDLITDAMSAMGMSTEDLDKYLDEMTRTAQKANTSVAQLGEATLVCAGAVKLTGQDLETMNTELGILANNGIKGAEGGTHLRNILLSLSAPTEKAEMALKKLHVEVADGNGDLRNLNDIMLDLNHALDGMGSADKAAAIKAIFNKTDIAAVNALLKGSSEEFGTLKGKIEDCEGAAENMAKTMQDNLQGKITILKSALEGLGVTFYDIFDEDAKKAVTSATEAVDRLQESMRNGELGEALDDLAAAFGNLMDEVLSGAEDALPGFINGLTWFIENLPTIIDGIEVAGTAWLAYEVATKAATISTIDFTAAIEANPIGIATAAVVALTVGLINLSDAMEEKLTPEMESYIRKCEGVADKTNNLANSSDDLLSKYRAEGTYVSELVSRLNDLQNKTSLTVAEQKEQESIVQSLNTIIPDLNLSISDQGRVVSETTENWRDYIDVMLEQAEAAAIQEKLIDIAEQRIDAEIALREIEEQLSEDAKKEIEVDKERNELLDRYNDLTDAELQRLDQLQYITDPLTKEQRALATEYEHNAEALENLDENQQNLTDRLSEISDVTEKATDATEGLTDAEKEETEALKEENEELDKKKQKLEEVIEAQVNSFEALKEGSALSIEEINNNLEENMKMFEEWSEGIETLVERGVDEGILQILADMGPQGAAQVRAFVDATDEELQQLSERWREGVTQALITSDDLIEQIYSAGQDATTEWINGALVPVDNGDMDAVTEAMVTAIAESPQWDILPESAKNAIIQAKLAMEDAAAETAETAETLVTNVVDDEVWESMPETIKTHMIAAKVAMLEAATEEDEVENPGTALADSMAEGFAESVEEHAEDMATATQSGVVDPIKQTIDEQFQTSEGAPSQTMVNYGENFITSVATGMENQKEPVLFAKVQSICEETFKKLDLVLGWQGTYYQKWWDVGMKVDKSIAQGIEDNQDLIASALQTAMDNAMNSLDMGSFTSMINAALGAAIGP